MSTFSILFLAALLIAAGMRLWLARRHVRYVQAHRNAVPAAFSREISLEAHQKAADYSSAKTRLNTAAIIFDALVLLALTFGGGLQAIDNLAASYFPEGILRGVVFVAILTVIMSVIELPFGLYRTFVIESRFGFNKMTLAMFFGDLAKHAAIGVALGLPLLFAVLWLMAGMGGLWWLYVWFVLVAYSLFLQMIYPAVVMPLFNKFSRLEDAALAGRIEQLLSRTGFRSRGLYVMDGSKRSSHGNAFFAGFGAAKRIVLFDTLVSRLQPGEVEAVLAHELGHYKLRHIAKGMALSWAFSFVLLLALGLLAGQPWFYEGLGVGTATMPIALLLFMLVVPEFTFFLQPLLSLFSRKNEYEADRYAAKNADASELVRALVKLYHDNSATLTPDPLHSAYYDSHPPAAMRIARLRTT